MTALYDGQFESAERDLVFSARHSKEFIRIRDATFHLAVAQRALFARRLLDISDSKWNLTARDEVVSKCRSATDNLKLVLDRTSETPNRLKLDSDIKSSKFAVSPHLY